MNFKKPYEARISIEHINYIKFAGECPYSLPTLFIGTIPVPATEGMRINIRCAAGLNWNTSSEYIENKTAECMYIAGGTAWVVIDGSACSGKNHRNLIVLGHYSCSDLQSGSCNVHCIIIVY